MVDFIVWSFNGAAFFQSGKCDPRRTVCQLASCFNGAAFFQSGKSRQVLVWRALSKEASMEPLFFKAENSTIRRCVSRSVISLQWSRFFSKRKMKRLRICLQLLPASMEPLFFKAENGVIAGHARLAAARASMEPLFFKAENNQPKRIETRPPDGFNGAAFFQSGK